MIRTAGISSAFQIRPRFAGILSRGVPWLLMAWLLVGTIPRQPWYIGAGVDASWYLAMNYIHQQGGRFGSEIAYTAGPLAYLLTPEPEFASGTGVLLLRLAMWCALALGAQTALKRFGPAEGAAVTFVLATQALLERHPADVWQTAYTAAFLGVMWAAGWAPVRLAIAGLAAGVSLLLKLNEGWLALALYYAVSIPAIWRHRPGRVAAAVYLAVPPAIAVLYFTLTHHTIWDLFLYIRNSFETMSGYSEAMSVDGPLWQLGLTMLYIALILSVRILSGESEWLRSTGLACFLMAAFLSFKHAMVRQDGHADLALQKLALAGLFLLAVCAAPHSRRVLLAVLVFGSSFTWFYVAQEQSFFAQFALSRLKPSGIVSSFRGLASWQEEYVKQQDYSIGARLHLRLPAEFQEKVGRATADGFPHCIDAIRANGWNYRPRPTIESSGAYTAKLDRLNSEHLSSSRAPRFVLFMWESIDGRHPLVQDAATLEALKTQYRPAVLSDRALLLERRAAPVKAEMTPAGEVSLAWNEAVAVPEFPPGEFVYFSAEIRPSAYGALRTFLLRAAPIQLRVWRRSGKEGWYRSLRRLLTIPVQIRPLPENLADFAEMLERPTRGEEDPVQSIAWMTPRPAEYDPEIRVKWFRVRWVADSEGGESGLAESTRGEQGQR